MNLLSHDLHFQIPFATLFAVSLLQYGHFCLALCFLSTLITLSLIFLPYLTPNLPADETFFVLIVCVLKWGCPDSKKLHSNFRALKIRKDFFGEPGFKSPYELLSVYLWGCPDLNRGRELPRLEGYQTTPQPRRAEYILMKPL